MDISFNEETVCAVVVTFNRKDLLRECLNGLCRQSRLLDAILIVDNASTDNTADLLLALGFIDSLPPEGVAGPNVITARKNISHLTQEEGLTGVGANSGADHEIEIIYVHMSENTGGAGGFYEGVRLGTSLGYDWVWLMDDDGYPDSQALMELLKYSGQKSIVVLNCLVMSNKKNGDLAFAMPFLDKDNKFTKINGQKYTKNLKELSIHVGGGLYDWGNFFNGTMIRSTAIKEVGNIKKEMFIWGDEQDYFHRLRKVGRISTVMSSFHYHPDDNKSSPPLWKMYFGLRNELYLNRKYRENALLRFFWSTGRAFPLFLKEKGGLEKFFKAIYESFKL